MFYSDKDIADHFSVRNWPLKRLFTLPNVLSGLFAYEHAPMRFSRVVGTFSVLTDLEH